MSNNHLNQVVSVIYPIQITTNNINQFQLGAIVRFNQTNNYGIVTEINQNDRPITITWDSRKEDPFAYTDDEIRFHKITVVSPYLTQQTLVKFPLGTTVKLSNGETYTFNDLDTFLVEYIDLEIITVKGENVSYQFYLEQFPGQPFANLIQLTELPQLTIKLELNQLRAKAKIWLLLNSPKRFLEIINLAWINQLKTGFINQLQGDYLTTDLEQAWSLALTEYLEDIKIQEGCQGFCLGSQVISLKDSQLQGKITEINLNQTRVFQITWSTTQIVNYSYLELQALQIIPIPPLIKISPNLVYQISLDRKYFKTFIGFRTKKLANAWLKPLREKLGKLSNLRALSDKKLGEVLGHKWVYEVEQFRHKTIRKRMEMLYQISQIDLDKMPSK